jgi:hypothetical protein
MALQQWNPMLDYVNPGIDDSRHVSSEQILIGAGPPRLAQIGGSAVAAARIASSPGSVGSLAYNIGALQQVSISQSFNLMRFFEIGSIRSYFIGGKAIGQMSIGRVLFHGPSLLRIMYAYYQDLLTPTVIPALYPSGAVQKNPHNVIISPGSNNFYLNLMSDLFRLPIGLLMYVRDSNQDVYGANYFEQCYIPSHQVGFDAQGMVLSESAQIQYERIVPVATASLDLISDNQLTGILS